MGNSVSLRSCAKINLALNVTEKRTDGYHNLETIMQPIALFDDIKIKRIDKPEYFKLVTNLPYLPTDGRNIAVKAATALMGRFEIKQGIFISVEKRIPISAGLGGGSSNGACVLLGLKKLFDLPISEAELNEIALKLGADVPFFLHNKTMLAEGVGEILTEVKKPPEAYYLLVKPDFPVSTAEIFGELSAVDAVHPDVGEILNKIEAGDLAGMCRAMGNSLEGVTMKKHPIIGRIKEAMMNYGALGALMSGSGPTVFGVFSEKSAAVEVKKKIEAEFDGIQSAVVIRGLYEELICGYHR